MINPKELKTKNDLAWQKLFEKYNIFDECLKKGYFEISSSKINEYREARLMTKFDHKNNLPIQFKKGNLTILPNKRGSYIIGNFDVYQELKYDNTIETKTVSLPHTIETLNPKDIYSESLALNIAHISGMLSQIINDEKLELTINGRMSSKEFTYNVLNNDTGLKFKFSVENSQIEIDGSYESDNYFLIIESKLHSANDFLARQLYYPYRTLEKRTSKKILPIFFTLSNDIYSFFVYEVENLEDYNSLKLIKQYNFELEHEKIMKKDLEKIVENTQIVDEPKIPFPQADVFERVIDLLSLLVENELTFDEITSKYDFDARQTEYYTNAARYLGLVEKYKIEKEKVYKLSEKGYKVMTKSIKNKYLSIINEILSHEIFYRTFKYWLNNKELPSKESIVDCMLDSNLYNINSLETFKRRSQTIRCWINWVINQVEY